jgi:hypothetical protein
MKDESEKICTFENSKFKIYNLQFKILKYGITKICNRRQH